VASGGARRVLRGQEDWVVSAQLSPDGKTALTASRDSTARLWDVASGRQLEVLRGNDGELVNAQFSADGKSVLTTSEKGALRRWPCDWCRPIEEISADVPRRVGRELTDQERERFGIPNPPAGKN
jgi:WD40 repeat protein